MKRWIKRHKAWSVFTGLLVLFTVVTAVGIAVGLSSPTKPQPTLAQSQNTCNLSGQDFLSTVNQWRSAVGAPPLTYSTQLEAGADARLTDMQQNQYYGHVNPKTKVQSYTTVMHYDTSATSEGEVLDANSSPSQELTDFKNSPEHYSILIDAKYAYFGGIAVSQSEGWASYDNDGNLETPAGTDHSDCLMIGEVADKDGSAPVTKAAITTVPSVAPKKSCIYTTIPYGTTYDNVSWIPAGQTEYSGLFGTNGLRVTCNGEVTSDVQPVNEIVYKGTSQSTPSVLPQYVPTTPQPSHADCVQSVHAQAPSADADSVCAGLGY